MREHTRVFFRSFLLCWLWLLPQQICGQGIQAGARMEVPEGSLVRVAGSFSAGAAVGLGGTLCLEGDLIDHTGLHWEQGKLVVDGAGGVQRLGGSTLTQICHLEIAAGAKLTLPAGKALTVTGSLVNHNGPENFHLMTGEGDPATLLHYQPGVQAMVDRYFPGPSYSWHMLSSPVKDHDIRPEFYGPRDSFFGWHEGAQRWVSIATERLPTFAQTNLDEEVMWPGFGYLVSYRMDEVESITTSFQGLLNQGRVAYVLSRKAPEGSSSLGYNLMGNPYPSFIDWDAAEGWEGKTHLQTGASLADKQVWIWNEAAGNFGVYSPKARSKGQNGAGPLIPPMTAFWVQAAEGADGEVLAMDDRVRVHPLAVPEKAGDSLPETGVLRLVVSAVGRPGHDEVVLEFGHEQAGGAGKFFSPVPGSPQLYTLAGDTPQSIRLLTLPENHQEILLGFIPGVAGTHRLEVEGCPEMMREWVLADKQTGREAGLSDGKVYDFRAEPGDEATRFRLKRRLTLEKP